MTPHVTANDLTRDLVTLDVEALATSMVDAARAALANRGPVLQAAAEMELRRLAGALADIGSLLAKGEIDPERAKVMANIHQLSVRSVLRSVEGLGVLAADQTLQAVTGVAASVLNRIVGFKLL
jgi:hypothetical protein